jgi:hypothetical protein
MRLQNFKLFNEQEGLGDEGVGDGEVRRWGDGESILILLIRLNWVLGESRNLIPSMLFS